MQLSNTYIKANCKSVDVDGYIQITYLKIDIKYSE